MERGSRETKYISFQGDFTRDEAQGFSISDEQPFIIILSIEDHPHARNFTLFHELGHLLLRDPGICKTEPIHSLRKTSITKTEDWCHRFAESFLKSLDRPILFILLTALKIP
jgi:Zn-dependent peptidase ImmA (M78 family)